jgi:hypothetical protein
MTMGGNMTKRKATDREINECAGIMAEFVASNGIESLPESFDFNGCGISEAICTAWFSPEDDEDERINEAISDAMDLALAKIFLPRGYKLVKKSRKKKEKV